MNEHIAEKGPTVEALGPGHYETSEEWNAAVEPTTKGVVRINVEGLCDRDFPHPRHVFTSGEYRWGIGGWRCPGQYAECRNCDDRKCMDCVTRTIHEVCVDDCPHCCPATKE